MTVRYSVLIPVYNVGALLKPCLDSILASVRACLAKTSDFAVEIVCVDDGSTDSSPAVLAECAASANVERLAFRVVTRANGGVAEARNSALAAAHGEYVLWCDADDLVRPEWLGEIDSARERFGNPDILIFDHVWECGDKWRTTSDYGYAAGAVPARRYLLDLLRGTRVACYLWSLCLRRSLFAGLKFDRAVNGLEDYMLLPEVARRARTVAYLPKALYAYRLRLGSLSNGGNGQRLMWEQGLSLRDEARWLREEGADAAAAAVSGQCAFAYLRCTARVLGEHGEDRDNSADAAFVRRRLPTLFFWSGIDIVWKLKFALCAFNLLGLMRRRWLRLRSRREAVAQ